MMEKKKRTGGGEDWEKKTRRDRITTAQNKLRGSETAKVTSFAQKLPVVYVWTDFPNNDTITYFWL
jgi:hypothetical protein